MLDEVTEIQLSYLAGIIDGEGHIGVHQTNRKGDPAAFSPTVDITSTSKELLEYIQLLVGGRLHNLAKETDKWKASFYLEWSGLDSVNLCKALYPYLFLKRPQASILITFVVGKSRYTEEDRLAQAVAFIQLKNLNKKGPTTL